MPANARRALAAAGVLCCVPLTACYFAVSWDGFDVSDATDASLADGTPESASDARESFDAGDGSILDGAAPCPTGDFCDDFERTTLLGPWDVTNNDGMSTQTITNHASTGNGALHTALASIAGARAVIVKKLPSASSVTVRYLLFLDSTVNRHDSLTPIKVNYSDRMIQLVVDVNGTNVTFDEQEFQDGGTTYFNRWGGGTATTGRWVEVIMNISLGSTAHATVTFDGATVYNGNLARRYGATEVITEMGTNYSDPGDPTSFDIDEVRVHIDPSN